MAAIYQKYMQDGGNMGDLRMSWRNVGTTAIGTVVVAAWIYWQYRLARWRADRKDQSADIKTLFDGKK